MPREKPETYWINFGQRAQAAGHSKEDTLSWIRPTALIIRGWVATGWDKQSKRQFRKVKL